MPTIYREVRRDGQRMLLSINGEKKEFDGKTLQDIVAYYKLDEQLVVTEVDGAIIGIEDRSSFQLRPDMNIEIVQFVGGG